MAYYGFCFVVLRIYLMVFGGLGTSHPTSNAFCAPKVLLPELGSADLPKASEKVAVDLAGASFFC